VIPWSPLQLEIALAAALGVAVLMALLPRRAPLFRPKSIGFGWTPNIWQGWVMLLALVFCVPVIILLVRLQRGG
jgi:hypothetical protein